MALREINALFASQRRKNCSSHRDGRPYLTDRSFNVSISHTRNHAAILIHPSKNVGIDIEEISDRVYRVASKFVSQDEYIDPHHEKIHLLLHWSAKETMFKLLEESEIRFQATSSSIEIYT